MSDTGLTLYYVERPHWWSVMIKMLIIALVIVVAVTSMFEFTKTETKDEVCRSMVIKQQSKPNSATFTFCWNK
jgi:hypothetical protein